MRAVQHELAVTVDQELLDLGIAAAFVHQLEHFAAQVVGNLRVGIGQRLVLALHAAQLGGECVEAHFLGAVAVLQWAGVAGWLRAGGERQAQP